MTGKDNGMHTINYTVISFTEGEVICNKYAEAIKHVVFRHDCICNFRIDLMAYERPLIYVHV